MDYFSVIIGLYLFTIGCTMGSFLNVLSDRLPQEKSILGRSHCENCHHTLSWLDLFPVFSYLFLGGRCRYCKIRLSFYYPAVEILTGVLFVASWFFIPSPINSVFYKTLELGVISGLLVIFFADLKFQIIPDSMHIWLLLCGLLLSVMEKGLGFQGVLYPLFQGLIVMSPILLLYVLTKGRGMGFGDVKLSFVIGVLFGIKLGLLVLYIAVVLGALISPILIIKYGMKMKSKVAFGSFLVTAMMVVLFFPTFILQIVHRIWGV